MIFENFWEVSGDKSPWGPFGPTASLNFSWSAAMWLALSGQGLTLDPVLSTVLGDDKLTISGLGFNGSTMTCRVTKSGQPWAVGDFAQITVRMYASDGQHDDRLFYLKLEPR